MPMLDLGRAVGVPIRRHPTTAITPHRDPVPIPAAPRRYFEPEPAYDDIDSGVAQPMTGRVDAGCSRRCVLWTYPGEGEG